MPELTIRNAKLFLPTGLVEGGLTVEGGKIKEISKNELPRGKEDINAAGKLVIPGAIDVHVHFFDPKLTQREDFESGSKAAAAGGVTTVISMPLDTPILYPDEIDATIEAGERDSIIDFGLHAGNMTKNSEKIIPEAMEKGIRTFKIFTSPPYALDRKVRKELMRSIDKAGGISYIHAEDKKIIEKETRKLKENNRKDPSAHAESRPNKAEEKAVKEVIADQRKIDCQLHFAHISTRQGAKHTKNAKEKTTKITAETCPQFLFFNKKDLKEKGPYLRINPPPKTERDVVELWRYLDEGVIDMVATDHAPGTEEEKEAGKENIWNAQIGIPGVETLLPFMLSKGWKEGNISLKRLVEVLCTNPAKRFGLYPQKGSIEKNTDADLVIIDQEKTTEIKNENMHYKVGWTPFEGMKIKGVPVCTISRGEIIAEEEKIVGKTGRGKYLFKKA